MSNQPIKSGRFENGDGLLEVWPSREIIAYVAEACATKRCAMPASIEVSASLVSANIARAISSAGRAPS